MRNFLIVLKFELLNFMKSKTFVVSTVIICLILAIGLSIPTIRDTFFGNPDNGTEQSKDTEKRYGYINKEGAIKNTQDLENWFSAGELREFDNQAELENSIRSGEVEAGYIVESPTKYQQVVENNELMNANTFYFEDALVHAYRIMGFEDRGIPYSEVTDLIEVNIEQDIIILGTDSAANYLYTYILVFGLYFVIIIYGQQVATSVASEKSNRAMEVLVTSTDSRNLIFGKVIGGALAGAIQFGLIIATSMIVYHLNATAWNNSLDFVFKIPSTILLAFSAFGILGYLLFLFIFGALGALVSRTEDVGTSATPVTIMFIAVFAIAVLGMQNTQGLLLEVASFVPLSSFMAMFVRVSMGTVSPIEVVISLAILVITTGIIGIFAAKIYRMGTLMYGNPVKLKHAIRLLRVK